MVRLQHPVSEPGVRAVLVRKDVAQLARHRPVPRSAHECGGRPLLCRGDGDVHSGLAASNHHHLLACGHLLISEGARVQNLALELLGISGKGHVRRPAVHARCNHEVVEGLRLEGSIALGMDSPSPLSAPNRLHFADRRLELDNVVQLESLGIQLDVGLDFSSSRKLLTLEIVRVREIRKLEQVLRHLQRIACVVHTPAAPNILRLVVDAARDANLHEAASCLEAGNTCADDCHRLHMGKVRRRIRQQTLLDAIRQDLRCLRAGMKELMDAVHKLVQVQHSVMIVIDHLEDTARDRGAAQTAELLWELTHQRLDGRIPRRGCKHPGDCVSVEDLDQQLLFRPLVLRRHGHGWRLLVDVESHRSATACRLRKSRA
mmetsp:Transcript_23479/g.41555  ORF Transcript_23479/g.41555 Transcript_23479/m.41555 type:complete len:374 (-) Transcript_23479:20-1141(-)